MTQAWAELLSPDELKVLRQCQDCRAKCCTYITVELADPEDDIDEWEAIRWYLTRPNTMVYIDDDGDWQLQIGERCRFLQDDHTCGIYENRPKVCADYDPKDCEYWDEPGAEHPKEWHSFEEFDAYYQEKVKPRLVRIEEREAKKRSAKARKAANARWAKHRRRTKNGGAKRKVKPRQR